MRLDVLPVLVGDFGEGQRGYVELFPLDEVKEEIERAREAIDLQFQHLAYYKRGGWR